MKTVCFKELMNSFSWGRRAAVLLTEHLSGLFLVTFQMGIHEWTFKANLFRSGKIRASFGGSREYKK